MTGFVRLSCILLVSILLGCSTSKLLTSEDQVRRTNRPIVVYPSDSLQVYYDRQSFALTARGDSLAITGIGMLQYRKGRYIQQPFGESIPWSHITRIETYERNHLVSIVVITATTLVLIVLIAGPTGPSVHIAW